MPFGFVQSPIVASLVLYQSNLGRAIWKLNRSDVAVSVYVDDIIVSGTGDEAVSNAVTALSVAADECGFEVNAEKQQAPGPSAVSFNIEFGSGAMRIIPDRMVEFELAVRQSNPYELEGILGYVTSVNTEQKDELSH